MSYCAGKYNRTLQEECTGNYYLESEPLKKMDDKILSYIDFYNYHRIHLSISYRTPAEMLHRLWKLYEYTQGLKTPLSQGAQAK